MNRSKLQKTLMWAHGIKKQRDPPTALRTIFGFELLVDNTDPDDGGENIT